MGGEIVDMMTAVRAAGPQETYPEHAAVAAACEVLTGAGVALGALARVAAIARPAEEIAHAPGAWIEPAGPPRWVKISCIAPAPPGGARRPLFARVPGLWHTALVQAGWEVAAYTGEGAVMGSHAPGRPRPQSYLCARMPR